MLDHTTPAVSRPPTTPRTTLVTSCVVKTEENETDWYQSTSVQNWAAIARTTTRAPATTSAVTSGRRAGVSVGPSWRRGGPASSSSKLRGGGPKLLSLTWRCLACWGGQGGRTGSAPPTVAAGAASQTITLLPVRSAEPIPHRDVVGSGGGRGRVMRQHGRVTSQPVIDPLSVAALDTERHVAASGWDQPARLFALVRTADLLEREPQLRDQMGPSDLADGALTAIEQEGLPTTSSLESLLGRLAWPTEVDGCAFAIERMVVPPEAERELPSRGDDAVEQLAAHPDRKDVRLLVAVLRDGSSICLLRQRDHDSDDAVATGKDIAPGLVEALKASFED